MSSVERKEIKYFLDKNCSLRKIGKLLARSHTTISDEIDRGSTGGIYDPEKAQRKAYARRHNASFRSAKIVNNNRLRKFVEDNLCDEQSPGAIAGRIKCHEKDLPDVSKNTIYDFLDSPYGKLIKEKRKKRKYRKKNPKTEKLKDRKFIDKRPKIVQNRERIGDCEGDFIVSGKSGKGYLLVVVDRKIRAVFIEQIIDVAIDNVHETFIRIKKRFPEMKTLTIDNDILFKMHRTLEKLLETPIYFCHSYHSWEKGSVENANKYIRKFIPKGSDISQYDKEYILSVQDKCNQRFMECLKYATPYEKLEKHRERIKKQRLHVDRKKNAGGRNDCGR